MPPRFAYWTILIDNAPTAFRARDPQELLPTLAQLKRKNPQVEMKWFARGRLWDSVEQEHEDFQRMRRARAQPPSHSVDHEKRGRDWRPGGDHKDPRARFDKEKRRRDKREAREARGDQPPRQDWQRRPDRPPRKDWQQRTERPPRKDWQPRSDRPPRQDARRDNRRDGSWRPTDRKTGSGFPPLGGKRPWERKTEARGQHRDDRKGDQRRPGQGQRPWRPKGKPRPWTKDPKKRDEES